MLFFVNILNNEVMNLQVTKKILLSNFIGRDFLFSKQKNRNYLWPMFD